MKWEISTKRNTTKIAVIVALVAFSTVFLLTGALLTSVYGIKPGDTGFREYLDQYQQPMKPYDNFIANGCLTKPWNPDIDTTIVLDTKGLEELGMFYYDPNTCFEIAKNTPGYIIDKVETYGEDQMKITMVKK